LANLYRAAAYFTKQIAGHAVGVDTPGDSKGQLGKRSKARKSRSRELNTASDSMKQLDNVLPLLNVFCLWSQQHHHYSISAPMPMGAQKSDKVIPNGIHGHESAIDSGPDPPAIFAELSEKRSDRTDGGTTSFVATATLVRSEARARSGVKAAMANLEPLLVRYHYATQHPQPPQHTASSNVNGSDSSRASTASATSGGTVLVREHIELRGFLPLSPGVDVSFASSFFFLITLFFSSV
jgi:hypothetical protein